MGELHNGRLSVFWLVIVSWLLLASVGTQAATTAGEMDMNMDGVTQGGMEMDGMTHAGMDMDGMTHAGMDMDDMTHAGMHMDGMTHAGMDMADMTHAGMHMEGMTHGAMDMDGMTHDTHDGMDDHMDHMDGDMDGMDHGVSGHYGVFHFTYDTVILIEKWTTSTEKGLIISSVVIAVVAALYEGLKAGRQALARADKTRKPRRGCSRFCNPFHLGQMVLHMVQIFISYVLMLIFMTFNVYLCISVVIGGGVGYFLFHPNTKNPYDENEHCN